MLSRYGKLYLGLLDQYNSAMQISREIFKAVIDPINFTDIYKDVTDFLNLLEKEHFLEYIDEGN